MKINVKIKNDDSYRKEDLNKLAKIIKSSKILEDVVVDYTNTILASKGIGDSVTISQEILRLEADVITPNSFMIKILFEQINIYKVCFILNCNTETETFDLSYKDKEAALITTYEMKLNF